MAKHFLPFFCCVIFVGFKMEMFGDGNIEIWDIRFFQLRYELVLSHFPEIIVTF